MGLVLEELLKTRQPGDLYLEIERFRHIVVQQKMRPTIVHNKICKLIKGIVRSVSSMIGTSSKAGAPGYCE